MTILDGKQTANDIKKELAVRVDQLILQGKRRHTLRQYWSETMVQVSPMLGVRFAPVKE